MPERLPTLPRQAWRPLVAVADSCSEAVGRLVREVAVTMGGYADEPRLVALEHLYEIFSMGLSDLLVPPKGQHAAINVGGRQLTSETITQNLRAMGGMWDGWAGGRGRPWHAARDYGWRTRPAAPRLAGKSSNAVVTGAEGPSRERQGLLTG